MTLVVAKKFQESIVIVSDTQRFDLLASWNESILNRIGVDKIKVYWNVDKSFYLNELTIKSNSEVSLAEAGDPLFIFKKI